MNRSDFTANWHTHNFRCRHARGDFADYARAAVGAGVAVLGVSDHCPTPDDRDIGVRMFHSDLHIAGATHFFVTSGGEKVSAWFKSPAEEQPSLAHLPESIVQRLDDALALCDRCGIAPATFTGVKGNRLVGQSVRNGIDTAVTVGGATPLSRRERRP